ncbi:phage tail protein [Kitasatospora sp. NBC_01302]|uniref:phage tail protein n=1 Tax=Kitasatospora sp. NBC_01302 TaxID=2903575 RepID=UPI002E13A9FE|nr:hypothetical protein OG294_24630 [Kitasatospora sp. NBC_01302]
MPAAGQIVGRVSVKVLPDTDDFRAKAQVQLDRIEKQLKVTVSAKIDATGLQRDLLTQIREINARNKTTDARKVRFYTAISTAGMSRAIQQAARDLQQRARDKKITFRADDVEVTGDIKLELDQANLDKIKHDLEHWRDKVSPLKVEVKLDIANGAGAAVSARLQVLTRPRTVPILPELDNTSVAKVGAALAALSGARVLNDIFEKLGRTLRNLDKSVPVIGSLALAIAGLAGWGLSAASNLAALSSSLAQIGPAALLLPGLLGGVAVGLGVTIAALKDFNKVLPEVKTSLSGLQDTISKNFWDKAAQPIRELVDGLLPKFTAGLAQTATQLGGFFCGLATGLQGALDPALNQMFTDLAGSITIATTGTGAFANIIAVLGKVGTSYLPSLAQWFVDISTRFSNFLTAAEGDSRLATWITTAIQNVKDLGSVLFNLGGILAGIGRAAQEAGGSTLGMLADTLERVHGIVDSSGFQAGLVGTFKAAHEAMANLASQAGPAVKGLFTELAQLAETILPKVGTILGTAIGAIAAALSQPAVTGGVTALFAGIESAVQALAPAMAPLGQALGALMQVIGAFAAMLGPLISAALVPLAQAFTALAPSIIPIIALLGGALTGAIQQLAPIVTQLVPIVGQLLTAAFAALSAILPPIAQIFGLILASVAPLVEQLVTALAPILGVLAQLIATVLTALTPVVAVLLQIITAVITPLLPMLQQVIAEFLPQLGEAFTRVVEAIQPFLKALLAVTEFLMPVLVPILKFVIEILANSLVNAINGVALVLEGFKEIFVGIWNFIKGFFEIWWGLFKGLFTGNWDTFKRGWSDLWNGICSFVKGIWDTILGLIEVVLNVGIIGLVGKGLKAVGGVAKAGWDAVATLFKDAWSGLGTAVSDGIGAVVTFMKDLPGKALDALGDIGSKLVEAGKSLIKGFIAGIGSMFGDVKKKLGDLTSSLTDWKGPETLDRVLLTNAGQLVIDGFIRGLESRYDAVRQSLKGLTDDVAGTEFHSPTIGQLRAARGVYASAAGALAGSSPGGTTKVLNYYAAPGSSLGAEEDLFTAAGRARMVGW